MDDKQYTELAIKVQEVQSRSRSNEHRIDEQDVKIKEIQTKQEAIYELTSSVKSIAQDMSYIKEDVGEVKAKQTELNDKVTVLENRPFNETQKRVNAIKDKLIWLFVGGITAYIFYLATGINL